MARIVGLQEISDTLRKRISQGTRPSDEALVLPGAYVSPESDLPKNVAFKLDGKATQLSPAIFSDQLFTGVSIVSLDAKQVQRLLTMRKLDAKQQLRALADAIPSEMSDPDLTVGPDLDGDSRDRDIKDWQCGFDSQSSCAGLYTAVESACPVKVKPVQGFHRAHTSWHLVCRAGPGVAASQFLTRLTAELNKGKTLQHCLSEQGEPGAAALRRLSKAGERNRARILLVAAEALGLISAVSSIGDTAAAPGSNARGAITTVTCSVNTLRPMDLKGESFFLYASGCCDSSFAAGGVIASSSPADGFILLQNTETQQTKGKAQRVLINEAHNCLPFCSTRMQTTRQTVNNIADAYREAHRVGKSGSEVHPDGDWLTQHFAWSVVNLQGESACHSDAANCEPPSLYGQYNVDSFLVFSRELAIANHQKIRLRPEMVCVAGMLPAKLRMVIRALQQTRQSATSSIATSECSTPRVQTRGKLSSGVLKEAATKAAYARNPTAPPDSSAYKTTGVRGLSVT